MTPYSPGDVVLVRFPFSDLATTRKRPAVVISPTEYASRHGDVHVHFLAPHPVPGRGAASAIFRYNKIP